MILVSTIKQSKTDPVRKGAYIYLAETNQQVCPVQAIARYFTNRRGTVYHFWWLNAHKRHVCFSLDQDLYKLKPNAWLYNTHSFLIGAATSTNQAGIPDLHIKTLGRWRSDTYQWYIRISPTSLASILLLLISKINSYNLTLTPYVIICDWACKKQGMWAQTTPYRITGNNLAVKQNICTLSLVMHSQLKV